MDAILHHNVSALPSPVILKQARRALLKNPEWWKRKVTPNGSDLDGPNAMPLHRERNRSFVVALVSKRHAFSTIEVLQRRANALASE